jgi:hypothetical protein
VFVIKSFGNFISTVVLGDFFTDQEDVGISLDLFVHGLVEGISVGEFDFGGTHGHGLEGVVGVLG